MTAASTGDRRAARETLQEIFARSIARGESAVAFDPATSPLHERAIFVIGAPRSGTTWLHQMIAAHPDVATGGESHIFCEGLAAVMGNHDDPDPGMKLSTWITRPELIGLMRQFVDGIFLAGAAARPGATRVLDKTPDHAMHAALLAEVYPDATYIHVIRHARDSVSSQNDLWAEWDPVARDLTAAASRWKSAVLDARTHLGGLRYLELRYEDLLADPVGGLSTMLAHAGLAASPELVSDIVEFGKAPINVRPSDPRIEVDKWAGIDPDDERDIVFITGELLVELGYLSPERRQEILARRPRKVAKTRTGPVGRITEVFRGGTSSPSSIDVRSIGRALAESATRREPLGPKLAHDVTADDRGTEMRGRDAVGEMLAGLLFGARIVGADGDARAAGIAVILADGRRQLHRYFVTDGKVSGVIVQGE